MKRLIVILAAFLVFVPAAAANYDAGPKPFHATTSAPEGLHAFLLSPNEAPQKYYPRTPSFAWSPVGVRGAGTYDFELSMDRAFNDASVLFNYTGLTIPAVSVAHQLPWMTGLPYALWAHVRWVSKDGKLTTAWSTPFGFNMRWTDSDYPQQLPAPEGLIRWKPIEGATRYEVLYPDINGTKSFETTTNVADEREWYTFHNALAWGAWSSVRWRVRAIRYIDPADSLRNNLPRVSFGPWSKVFTSVNPPMALGTLAPTATVSDVWDTPGHAAAHELTPGFAWTPSLPMLGDIGSVGSSLYRVYIFTDDHCVNQVFAGSIVGSPAYAPRTFGGPIALPSGTKSLGDWMNPPYLMDRGAEPNAFDATGHKVVSNESPGKGAANPETGVADANVDLWDSGWPNGRYYWTVVPVIASSMGVFDPKSSDLPIQYHDGAVAQDQCESGRGMSFGKVSQPVVTAGSNVPWVSGLAPDGRVIASASKVPAVHDSPLVAWEPAVGATTYDIQLSHKSYPWKTTWSTSTPATSVVLPLGKAAVGTWYYRVRGINPALPVGAQAMSWSNAVRLRVTGDSFVVVKK
jgi:hypothetical protein